MTLVTRRHLIDRCVAAITWVLVAIAITPLLLIVFHIMREGASALSFRFLTSAPVPPGEPGGGIGHALVGSIMVVGLGSLLGVPLGVLAGLYVAENRGRPLARTVRFVADVLNGLPSILFAIFAWQVIVRPMGRFSAIAGGVALAVLLAPMIARTTEEIVRTVPDSLREAAISLGYPRWRVAFKIVVPAASIGILTGVSVAIARAAGETAPLIFTAFGNQFWSLSIDEPVAVLPLQIFTYAISPFEEWHRAAWAAALVLIVIVAALGIGARAILRAGLPREFR